MRQTATIKAMFSAFFLLRVRVLKPLSTREGKNKYKPNPKANNLKNLSLGLIKHNI